MQEVDQPIICAKSIMASAEAFLSAEWLLALGATAAIGLAVYLVMFRFR